MTALAVMVACAMQIYSTNSFSADITRNLPNAASYHNMPWKYIFLERDWFIGLSGKLLSYISTDLRFYTIVYMLIKVFLELKCLKIIADNISIPMEKVSILVILTLLFTATFFNINSLRFSIATSFFIWCMLEVLVNQKKYFIFISLLSPFVHYGFWILVPVIPLYFILKNRTKIVYVIFILSLVYSTAGTSIVINDFVSDNMNENIAESVSGYASEFSLEGMAERYAEGARLGNTNRAIHRGSVDVRNYGIMACVVILSLLHFKSKKENARITETFNTLLILYSCANIANSNSQGQRFYLVCALIAVFCFAWLKYNRDEYAQEFYTKRQRLFETAYYLGTISGLMGLYMARYAYNWLGVMFGNYLFHLN